MHRWLKKRKTTEDTEKKISHRFTQMDAGNEQSPYVCGYIKYLCNGHYIRKLWDGKCILVARMGDKGSFFNITGFFEAGADKVHNGFIPRLPRAFR